MRENRTRSLGVRVSFATYNTFRNLCAARGLGVSQVLRNFVATCNKKQSLINRFATIDVDIDSNPVEI